MSSFLPLVIIILILTTVLEMISTQYFYGSLFRWGIPIVKRTMPLPNPKISLPIGQTTEMVEGVYKFADENNIYFRLLDNVFSFQFKLPVLLVKLTAHINREQGDVVIVARIHLALTLFAAFMCMLIASIAILTIVNHLIIAGVMLIGLVAMLFKFYGWYQNAVIKVDLLQAELLKLLEGLSNEVPQQDYQ